MNTKRMICVLLLGCMMLGLAACHTNDEEPQASQSVGTNKSPDLTSSAETTENSNETETPELPPETKPNEVSVLTLDKTLHT